MTGNFRESAHFRENCKIFLHGKVSFFTVLDTVEPWLKTTLIQRPPCYKDHFQRSPFKFSYLPHYKTTLHPRSQPMPPQYKDHFGCSPKVVFISRFDCMMNIESRLTASVRKATNTPGLQTNRQTLGTGNGNVLPKHEGQPDRHMDTIKSSSLIRAKPVGIWRNL